MKASLTSALLVLCLTLSAPAARADELEDLVTDARATVTAFASDPNMDWFRDNVSDAQGLLIIPRLRKGGFIFGGAGGSGVLLARDPKTGDWSYPAFYTMGSISVGAQIGGATSQVILMIMTQQGMDSMLATSVKVGADVDAAAGPVGVGTKAATADILAFSRSQGLFAGANVEGAILASRASWNEAYYGRPARPIEILVDRVVHHPQADLLREAIASLAGGARVPVAANRKR